VRFRKQSGKIDGPGSITRKGDQFAKTFSYSFGVGREQMKKVYIDAILKQKAENRPGPGTYE